MDPIRPPELSELEAFALAVDEGSIARAARRLRISPPAAAKRIRQLEALARTPLLIRGKRGVRPTETGAQLYPAARNALAARARVVEALAHDSAADPLRIAGIHQVLGRARVPAEDVLDRSDVLFAALFHASHDPIIISRAEDGLVFEINDAAVTLTGYAQHEIRGRQISKLNLWENIAERDRLVGEAIETAQPTDGTLVLITRAGKKRQVLVRFQAIELHGIRYLVLLIQPSAARRS